MNTEIIENPDRLRTVLDCLTCRETKKGGTVKNRRKVSLFLVLTGMLLCCGCSLPRPMPMSMRTESASSATAAYIQTEEAMTPSLTMLPTNTPTPVPSETPTPEPSPIFTVTFGPSPTATLGPEFFHGSWHYEPGFVSQYGLKYNGMEITTGCTAACVQMVLDFWHAYKNEYPTMGAQALINQNIYQKQFNVHTGLNILDTEDDLQMMDYYLGVRENSSKEELLAALERYGPLLILTKVNWSPYGTNHMAVLTGYDPGMDMVRLLDPWQIGGSLEMTYDEFDSIWKLNYSETEFRQRAFFFIVPYPELRRENELFIPWYVFLYRQ